MPELALDHRQRHPFSGELDRVRMVELMRRQPAPHPGSSRVAAQLTARRGRGPRPLARRPVDHAEQRTDRQLDPGGEPRSEMIALRPRVHPDLTAAIPFAGANQNRSASRVEI